MAHLFPDNASAAPERSSTPSDPEAPPSALRGARRGERTKSPRGLPLLAEVAGPPNLIPSTLEGIEAQPGAAVIFKVKLKLGDDRWMAIYSWPEGAFRFNLSIRDTSAGLRMRYQQGRLDSDSRALGQLRDLLEGTARGTAGDPASRGAAKELVARIRDDLAGQPRSGKVDYFDFSLLHIRDFREGHVHGHFGAAMQVTVVPWENGEIMMHAEQYRRTLQGMATDHVTRPLHPRELKGLLAAIDGHGHRTAVIDTIAARVLRALTAE